MYNIIIIGGDYMIEIWRDINEYEGIYQVSNLGNVRSVDRIIDRGFSKLPLKGKILSPSNNAGYLFVILSKNCNAKTAFIHRLVAETFIPNPDNLPCVNHKDENPLNNRVDNLEWCTYSYNNSYKRLAKRKGKLKQKIVIQYSLDGDFIKEWENAEIAANSIGLTTRAIYNCCQGRTKTSGGYKWKYKNNTVKKQ